MRNPGANPSELFALLLLTVPSVFTFTKLLELPAFGERSHQLAARRDTGLNRNGAAPAYRPLSLRLILEI